MKCLFAFWSEKGTQSRTYLSALQILRPELIALQTAIYTSMKY